MEPPLPPDKCVVDSKGTVANGLFTFMAVTKAADAGFVLMAFTTVPAAAYKSSGIVMVIAFPTTPICTVKLGIAPATIAIVIAFPPVPDTTAVTRKAPASLSIRRLANPLAEDTTVLMILLNSNS